MQNNLNISPLNKSDQKDFIRFCDEFIGVGYFHSGNFSQQIDLSSKDGHCSSFTLKDDQGIIVGVRITYVPAQWQKQIEYRFISAHQPEIKTMAYFKSLFIDPKYQKLGLGPLLSAKSIETLKKLKAKSILTHSWMESPNNSSVRYLKKSGFQVLGEIPRYWKDYDYLCTGCQVKPCLCTAVEMIYKIK